MSVFYVLPTRAAVARHFAHYVESWFPGAASAGPGLADRLVEIVQAQADAYAVFADEVSDKGGLMASLRESHGAEPGDWVIDLRGGPRPMDGRADRRVDNDHLPSPLLAPPC